MSEALQTIPGVGPAAAKALLSAGVRTAAEVGALDAEAQNAIVAKKKGGLTAKKLAAIVRAAHDMESSEPAPAAEKKDDVGEPPAKRVKSDDIALPLADAPPANGGGGGAETSEKATADGAERAADGAGGTADGAGKSGPRGAGEKVDLTGTTFATSGVFKMGRFTVENLMQKAGSRLVSAVNKSTSYFVLGGKGFTAYGQKMGPGSKKHKDAKKSKRCQIVDEEWVMANCGGGGASTASVEEAFNRLVAALREQGEPAPPPGASEEELKRAESELGFSIPGQYRQLLKLSNGPFGFSSTARLRETNDYIERFAKAMKMVNVQEYVCVDSSGIVFEWDSSFDSQCGNKIVADSVVDLLDMWTKRIKGKEEKRGLFAAYRDYDNEVDIDKSPRHASFFKKFKSTYERIFRGRWPMYVD